MLRNVLKRAVWCLGFLGSTEANNFLSLSPHTLGLSCLGKLPACWSSDSCVPLIMTTAFCHGEVRRALLQRREGSRVANNNPAVASKFRVLDSHLPYKTGGCGAGRAPLSLAASSFPCCMAGGSRCRVYHWASWRQGLEWHLERGKGFTSGMPAKKGAPHTVRLQ